MTHYRHYKGPIYKILIPKVRSTDNPDAQFVIYELAEGHEGPPWSREFEEFHGMVTLEDGEGFAEVKRFQEVCPKCNGKFTHGKAMQSAMVAGMPDFPGDDENSIGQTMHAGGPGKLVNVMKCRICGFSRK